MNALRGSGKWFEDVRVGDSFASALAWSVVDLLEKPRHGGGIVALDGNQIFVCGGTNR